MKADEEIGGPEEGKRRSKRSLVLLAAKLKTSRGEIDVRLRNLSQTGALLETAEIIPGVDSDVVFERGTTVVAGRVAWIKGSRFGLQFNEPIEESEVLVHVGPSRRQVEHKPSVSFRRTALQNPKLSQTEQKIADAWVKRVGPTARGD